MDENPEREQLRELLRTTYRQFGWRFTEAADGTIAATDDSGITWHGVGVVEDDVEDAAFAARLLELSSRRMANGNWPCPLDLLPTAECEDALYALLDRIGLGRRNNVTIYRPSGVDRSTRSMVR